VTSLLIVCFFIFLVAVAMTMVGKGGGNFYVIILAMANIPMHEAATTGQFILFSASVAALITFQNKKILSWKLAFIIGTSTALSALAGGYFSHIFSGFSLKLIFAVLLLISGAVMLIPVSDRKKKPHRKHVGIITITSGAERYTVNLFVGLPVTVLTGFSSGMVGVSGGSFLVPLMVLACGVPMHIAVGTASTLIAATAFMGFSGHVVQGDFNPSWALPLAFITIIGGILGARFALHTKPKYLKQLFAFTNWLAALFMIMNAIHTKGII